MEEYYRAGNFRVVVKQISNGRWQAFIYRLGVKKQHAVTPAYVNKHTTLLEASLLVGVPFNEWVQVPENGETK